MEWISVKDRMPYPGDIYLVYGDCTNKGYKHIDMALYSDDGVFEKANPPTHWMPLPEPPKE